MSLPIVDCRLPIDLSRHSLIGNRHWAIGNRETHPLARGGTDLTPKLHVHQEVFVLVTQFSCSYNPDFNSAATDGGEQ